MFINNKYTKIYYQIIARHKSDVGEKHHIIPRSFGGSDDQSNLVVVKPRVHFILHRLLCKMSKDQKHKLAMCRAFWCMCNLSSGRDYRVNSRAYDSAKEGIILSMKIDNPMFKEEHRRKLIGRSRPEQSEVMSNVNRKRWANKKPKISYSLICKNCGSTFTHSRKNRTFCSKKCSAIFGASLRKEKPVVYKPRTAWNKGKENPKAAENGKRGAEKQSQTVTGRRIFVGVDGLRHWGNT